MELDSTSLLSPLLDPTSVEHASAQGSNFFHLRPFLRTGAATRRGTASAARCTCWRGCGGGDADGGDDGDGTALTPDRGSRHVALDNCMVLTSDRGSGHVALGPCAMKGGVATAGPDPPRLSPPDPHSPSFFGAVGPALGTLGCPC